MFLVYNSSDLIWCVYKDIIYDFCANETVKRITLVEIMSNEIESIVNGDIDLYEFLEVGPTFKENEIKRQYRRKALQYHPDKNPGEDAAKKFHFLSQVYEILSNDKLRYNYNKIRQLKINKLDRLNKLSEQTRAFKEELEKAEKEYKFNNSNVFDNTNKEFVKRKIWENNLEKLKEEGLKKRRIHEKEIIEQSASGIQQANRYIPFNEIPLKLKQISLWRTIDEDKLDTKDKQMTKTIVKWKHKPELKELITADILLDMMIIFGQIKSAKIIPNTTNSRYDSGLVEYEDPKSAELAVNHDYKKSATLWDGTKVRKLASLLRECKYDTPTEPFGNIEMNSISVDETQKIRKLITKLNQLTNFNPPSKYTIENLSLKSDTHMDQILNSFILKEARNELL